MAELKKKSFKDTLNLPATTFPLRANASEKEPELLLRWQKEEIYEKTYRKSADKEMFLLHDGPPYANGHIHIGTAINKILKDIVCKYKRMSGYFVPYKPGWDCHGLPIEFRVINEEQAVVDDPIKLKAACRAFAQKWIDIQRDEFKQLGVIGGWHDPYSTMDPSYEADIVRSFACFVEKGYIERKGKTVPWCPTCQTVLATAEVEYHDRKDPSCYLLFPFADGVKKKLFADLMASNPDLAIGLLIWTTTPWTIPLNRAVALNPKAAYVVLQGDNPNQAFIVVSDRADVICELFGIEKKVLARVAAQKFKDTTVQHPFIADLHVPILLEDMVQLSEGTGVLHMAPGCGPEDYVVGVRHGLEIFSPLSPDGSYTKGIQPPELAGMKVSDAQGWVLRTLTDVGALMHKTSIRHAYPHCWRCRNPLIFRATEQWFCNLHAHQLIERTLAELATIAFIPALGEKRLYATVEGRTEWCMSRQRVWGTPIPALLCKKCGWAYLDANFIRKVADGIAKEGIEYWDRISIEEMTQQDMLPRNFACGSCGNADVGQFEQERDILDVWFEAGVSHFAVLENDPLLTIPADVYLEGSDQHRGWFQSSLLTSMAMRGTTCTKKIVTHGYVVDKDGKKMSKSLGNVIAPHDMIKQFSVDILRLWAASVDFESDVVISQELMRNVAGVYRRIRNTCRFLLSNVFDFDVTKDIVSIHDMLAIDQYAMAHLHEVSQKIHDAYERYHFATVSQTFGSYCANDLSAIYLDIIKDRLYVEKADGLLRRSTQTVCWHILDTLTRLLAPILSFLSEEISDHYQEGKEESIHLQQFATVVDAWETLRERFKRNYVTKIPHLPKETPESITFGMQCRQEWINLHALRDQVLKALEVQREAHVVKHSLEAKITLYLDQNCEEGQTIMRFIRNVKDVERHRFLKDFLIVSQSNFAESSEGLQQTALPWLFLSVAHADGTKCPRCWQWEVTDHVDGLCQRCVAVLS